MNLLLTGATGFVGRNALLAALGRYETIWAPVRQEKKLREQLAGEGLTPEQIARVVPLSAKPAEWPSIAPDHAVLGAGLLFARERDEYFRTNVAWMLDLLAALPAAAKTVILSSQAAGGPTPPSQPARSEADADAPVTWYGESKREMERRVRDKYPDRAITILRPPMVLGPRDLATLPLFRMARGAVRIKPGWRTKTYSFIAVEDLVEAIFVALAAGTPGTHYVAAGEIITDWELIAGAAEASKARGFTAPLPMPAVRLLAACVDAIPPLREAIPSLTKDRANDIWPDRWVVDGAAFSTATGWRARRGLGETLRATREHYVKCGLL